MYTNLKRNYPTIITIGRFASWGLTTLKNTFFGIGGIFLFVIAGLYIAGALIEPVRWYLVGIASALLILCGGLLALAYVRLWLNRSFGDLRTQVSDIKKEISAGKSRDIEGTELSDAINRIDESRRLLNKTLKRLAMDDDPASLRQVIEPINNLLLSLQINQIVNASHAVTINSTCRVCPSDEAFRVSLTMPKDGRVVTKYLCRECHHLYSNHLDDLQKTIDRYKEAALTNTARNVRSIEQQKRLMTEAIRYGGLADGNILDFGCGGAGEASKQLNNLYKNKDLSFYACDIFDADDKQDNYFQLYREDHSYYGKFSAIVSNAVIEHTANPVGTWLTLNRLLRSTAAGGGIMVHAFPSLINYDLSISHIIADTHVCLYSYESLKYLCDTTGFEYITHCYDVSISHHPIFYFRKTRDCL